MGEHRALGDARRAAGVLQDRQIIASGWLWQREDLEALAVVRWPISILELVEPRIGAQRLHVDGGLPRCSRISFAL